MCQLNKDNHFNSDGMKGFFLLVLSLTVSCISAFEATFETSIAIKNALAQEYAYKDEKLISRLDWQNQSIPVFSCTAQAELFNFIVRTKIDTAIPSKNGVMEDYDFLIENTADPSQYSNHDAYIDKDFTATSEIGYGFRFSGWEILPALGFSYINRKWTAQDGYMQYPVYGIWTGNEQKQHISGTVISYEQAVWFPFLSLTVGYTFKNRFGFSLSGYMTFFIQSETIDTHFLRLLRFYDTMENGAAWGVSLKLYYFISQKQLAFFIGGGYSAISNLTGNTSSSNIGVNAGNLIIDEGGQSKMKTQSLMVSLGIILKIAHTYYNPSTAHRPFPTTKTSRTVTP
jgi:outer membrane protease